MASIPRRINNPFRATRVTSEGSGSPGASNGGARPYRGIPTWPGIWDGNDARCECSWAWRGETGRMEVKRLSALCPVGEHRRPP